MKNILIFMVHSNNIDSKQAYKCIGYWRKNMVEIFNPHDGSGIDEIIDVVAAGYLFYMGEDWNENSRYSEYQCCFNIDG